MTGAAVHVPAIKSGLSGGRALAHGTRRRGFLADGVFGALTPDYGERVTGDVAYMRRGGATGTGERVSIITSHVVIEGYEPVPIPAPGGASRGRPQSAMFRRRSLQPSRRAVLHLQAAGDPAVPSGLGDWFTERAFHFYLAGLRLPGGLALASGLALTGGLALAARDAGRAFGSAFADLDAACAQLRDADGIAHVIVAAHGRAALAVALWADARGDVLAGGGADLAGGGADLAGGGADLAGGGPDAVILFEPALPARPAINLSIVCPVLVLTSPVSSEPARTGSLRSGPVRVGLRQHRPGAAIARLGSHVTWLQLREPGEQAVVDELGRWLGAYMYGSGRDRLL